jgi:hypothetical protein
MTDRKYYSLFFENDVRGDGEDSTGPFITYLSDEEVTLFESDVIFPFVQCEELMEDYPPEDENHDLAVAFNEVYNVREWMTGPVLVEKTIAGWMSTDI